MPYHSVSSMFCFLCDFLSFKTKLPIGFTVWKHLLDDEISRLLGDGLKWEHYVLWNYSNWNASNLLKFFLIYGRGLFFSSKVNLNSRKKIEIHSEIGLNRGANVRRQPCMTSWGIGIYFESIVSTSRIFC